MGKKLKLRKKSKLGAESPGPAAYRTYEKILSPRRSISMPKERRPLGDSSDKLPKFNVGPGQYELESIFEKKKNKGNKFSTDIDKRSPEYVEPHLR